MSPGTIKERITSEAFNIHSFHYEYHGQRFNVNIIAEGGRYVASGLPFSKVKMMIGAGIGIAVLAVAAITVGVVAPML